MAGGLRRRRAWREDMPGTAKSPGGTDRRARSTASRHPPGRQLQPSRLPKGLRGRPPPPGPPVTLLEASRSILARSGQGSAAGDGLAICKALQLIAFVAEGRGDRGGHDPAIFPAATPIHRGRGRLIAKRRRAGGKGSGGGREGSVSAVARRRLNASQFATRLRGRPCHG